MDQEQKKLRRGVLLLIAVSTLAFLAVLLGLSVMRVRVPQMRTGRIEMLLESGDTAGARELIARVDDEAAAESFLARCDYLDAEEAFSRGDWIAARRFYASAGSWQDSAEKVRLCDYNRAADLFSAGSYEEAETLFSSLGGFSDAADRVLSCRYERASALEDAGDLSGAAAVFETLGSYLDAHSRLVRIAKSATNISDDEEALAAFRGMSPELRDKMAALGAARDALPQGVIAVGFYHTVGLRADGSVVACGDNSYGQCDVSSLHDVSAVAAGAYHTVALHRDGTVSAVGRGSERQCDTASWRDVAAVTASDYATFGMTRDGNLLCTGFYDYKEPESWSGLAGIAGGSYNLAALRTDGTVWTFPKLKDTEALRGCVSLGVNTGFAVGVMPDGSAVSSVFDLSGWKDVVAVSASGTAILGLDMHGRVLAHFFRESDAVDFSSFRDVRAVAAGGTHFVLVLSDGSVKVLGGNSRGEAETGDWVLRTGA